MPSADPGDQRRQRLLAWLLARLLARLLRQISSGSWHKGSILSRTSSSWRPRTLCGLIRALIGHPPIAHRIARRRAVGSTPHWTAPPLSSRYAGGPAPASVLRGRQSRLSSAASN